MYGGSREKKCDDGGSGSSSFRDNRTSYRNDIHDGFGGSNTKAIMHRVVPGDGSRDSGSDVMKVMTNVVVSGGSVFVVVVVEGGTVVVAGD